LLSSAILYVAIVAIWACVLIPRWLRRDSAGSASAAPAEAEEQATVAATAEEEPAPVPVPVPVPAPRRRRSVVADQERRPTPEEDPAPADPAHRRVLSARRRLLLMLVGLSIASGALAGAKMAAWWVIVPPSVMLFGYLFLLRAASRADTERRDLARYQMAREAARAPARRPAPVAPTAPAVRVAPAAPAARVPEAAKAARAKVITIPPAPEEIYDQYADAKLRAVGD
jgi:hypothetical protein